MDITYSENRKTAEFNGNHYVRDDKKGYYLCHDGYGAGHRLHRDVWEYYNGHIPDGYHIHHKDHDKSNNDILNLELLSESDHRKRHGDEMTDEQKERARKNLLENVSPLSKQWHGSKEGKEWHSKQAKIFWNDKKPITYKCDNCGKEFETTNSYSKTQNKFCSNACKSAYRRKSGVDNVERVCEFCGKTFICGKYQKRKYCSVSCGKKAYWENKRNGQR